MSCIYSVLKLISIVDCEWDAWGEWDTCSQTCGGGMTARVRNIKTYSQFGGAVCEGQAAEMNVCNNQTCPCKFFEISMET